jgi:hypothetical protein
VEWTPEPRRDGEASVGIGDGVIGLRRMEHPCGDNKRGGVDDDGGGRVSGDCRRWCGHRSCDKHGRDGEAGVGVGDGAIESRKMEHPRGNEERGWSNCFDGSRRWERRVIGGDLGMQGSEESGGSRKRRGGEVAAMDTNCREQDGDAANGEMIRSTAKEKE